MTLIAIVEDEASIADILDAYLQREGFATCCLPDLDGLTLCRAVRARSAVPIVMVTARVDEIDRLLGLELGADDYVCKPFSPREVVARVKAVLRRTAAGGAPPDEVPAIRIDDAGMMAWLHGARLDLTPTEFRLFAALARRPGRVLSRGHLLDAVSDRDRDVFDRSVDSHIKNLRRKLTAACGQDVIASIYGVGYRLDI